MGVGLYLTVERWYPTSVVVGAALLALAIVVLLGWVVSTGTVATEVTPAIGVRRT